MSANKGKRAAVHPVKPFWAPSVPHKAAKANAGEERKHPWQDGKIVRREKSRSGKTECKQIRCPVQGARQRDRKKRRQPDASLWNIRKKTEKEQPRRDA